MIQTEKVVRPAYTALMLLYTRAQSDAQPIAFSREVRA